MYAVRVNNNVYWTDIERLSLTAWNALASQLAAGEQSPTTHHTVLVAPHGDHTVDHERFHECAGTQT